MTFRSEPAEPVHVDDAGERRKRLAALLVVKPAQPAMTLRIGIEVDADAALSGRDGCAAARAERSFRTTATAWHRIEGHNSSPRKIRPDITVSWRYRRANRTMVRGCGLPQPAREFCVDNGTKMQIAASNRKRRAAIHGHSKFPKRNT